MTATTAIEATRHNDLVFFIDLSLPRIMPRRRQAITKDRMLTAGHWKFPEKPVNPIVVCLDTETIQKRQKMIVGGMSERSHAA
jgi:hypothetical protein